MPKINLTAAASDAAIAADPARKVVVLSISQGSSARFSFGTTFTEADSQEIRAGQPWSLENDAAKLAFSFGPCTGPVRIDVTLV